MNRLEPTRAARLSLALASAAVAVMAVHGARRGSVAAGLLVPLGGGPTVSFWLIAGASVAFATVAIVGGRPKPAIGAPVLLATSLIPCGVLLFHCIGGDCL